MLPSGGKVLKDKADARYISVMSVLLRLQDGNSHKIVTRQKKKHLLSIKKKPKPLTTPQDRNLRVEFDLYSCIDTTYIFKCYSEMKNFKDIIFPPTQTGESLFVIVIRQPNAHVWSTTTLRSILKHKSASCEKQQDKGLEL